MSATESGRTAPRRPRKLNEHGVAAVEFAIVAFLFFLMVFGIIEFARVMYMFNALPEVTRRAARAAANISFTNGDALELARKRAVFDEIKGALPVGSPITYRNIRIEYLYLPAKASELMLVPLGSMPHCPTQNRTICMNDPNSPSCIRAVQVSVCDTATDGNNCTPVPYQSVFPFIPLSLSLPKALTIVSAETLGYRAGDDSCT
jgi:hypothetical protein